MADRPVVASHTSKADWRALSWEVWPACLVASMDMATIRARTMVTPTQEAVAATAAKHPPITHPVRGRLLDLRPTTLLLRTSTTTTSILHRLLLAPGHTTSPTLLLLASHLTASSPTPTARHSHKGNTAVTTHTRSSQATVPPLGASTNNTLPLQGASTSSTPLRRASIHPHPLEATTLSSPVLPVVSHSTADSRSMAAQAPTTKAATTLHTSYSRVGQHMQHPAWFSSEQ